jgi:outer membrane immunogenic protein
MRNRLIASLAGAAFSFAASDLAVAADKPVSWTGWYVGGNVGGSWGNARTDIAGSGTTVALSFFFRRFPANVAFGDANTARLNGGIGGGQIGYNYQFGPRWVLGFEADIQGSSEWGSSTFIDPFSTTICVLSGVKQESCLTTPGRLNATAATAYDAKINWFGTVRGRLGTLIGDEVLLYGTGGLAYGNAELSGVTNVNGSVNSNFGTVPLIPGANAFSRSGTRVGYAVGGGIEGKSYWIPAGWTWKVEYLYVDLGSVDTVAPFPGGASSTFRGPLTLPFTGAITTHTRFTDNIVRVGLNYTFGYAAAPAVYK